MVGAGNRGLGYAQYALDLPDHLRIVGVVEPRDEWRDYFARLHNLPSDATHAHVSELLTTGARTDVVINATPDRAHVETTIWLLDAGYQSILLEKPLGSSIEELAQLSRTAERTKASIQVCHVLRYTPFFQTLHDIVQAGELGDVITVRHQMNLASSHFAHSYVRGNWANEAMSSPLPLAKACHDFDVLSWILDDCFTTVSSIGGLTHFTSQNAPVGSTYRCDAGCAVTDTCRFYAPRIYVNDSSDWPASVVWPVPDPAVRAIALANSPYGRCVYHCDNDVPDQLIVLAETLNGVSVSIAIHGHAIEESRVIEIVGSRATLYGRFERTGSSLSIRVPSAECRVIDFDDGCSGDGGHAHGGGDFGLMADFVEHVRSGNWEGACTLQTALHSHVVALAAAHAQRNRQVIDVEHFAKRAFSEHE